MPDVPEAVAAAIAAYRTSIGPYGEPAALAYAAGRAWEVAGRHDDAVDAFLDAADGYDGPLPQRLVASLVRGTVATGRTTDVADRLAAHPAPDRRAWAGILRVTGGDLAGGAAVLVPALEDDLPDPTRATATEALAHALVALGRVDEALDACAASLARRDLPAVRATYAGLLVHDGRPDDALAEATRALEGAPDHAPAHLVAGSALAWLGRRAEAEASLARAVALAPELRGQAAAVLG